MAEDRGRTPGTPGAQQVHKPGGFLGSLKEALVAASREDPTAAKVEPAVVPPKELPKDKEAPPPEAIAHPRDPAMPTAAEAAREARGALVPVPAHVPDRHVEFDAPPTTRVVRSLPKEPDAPVKTQLVRGKQDVKRGQFQQDPVVGWVVVVGGPGIGAFRPIFEGNNTIGRASTQRIPLDFGDDAISSEEQAYIRYDSIDRSFLFVPNLAKTNVVSINSKRPSSAVPMSAMDVITVGRTQLVFVPFCGTDFDWSELAKMKT